MINAPHQIAPGTRLRIRDEDWLVRRVDRASSGQRRFSVVGLSSLVRDRESLFLEGFEEEIEIIDPATTSPVADKSANYRDTRLHLESLLRETTPEDAKIHLGHQAALDVVPYQLDPASLALQQPRQRILISDAVGLGKTIEAGVLLTELIRRGKGRRILVLTVKSMLTQFQKELWARFTIPLTRLDSTALQRIRTEIPANHNPFHYYDKSIISIDTVKQDGEYRNFLEGAYWDIIVVDEAHNVARRSNNSLRHRAAARLAERCDSLVLLSATPHDGKKESFASLMNLLNPTAIKDEKNYGPKDIEGLFIRRFKKDIQDQVKGAFPTRLTHTHTTQATAAEENAYHYLAELEFSEIDRHRGGQILFKTLLEKSLFSSPAACLETIANRLKTIEKHADPTRFTNDIRTLTDLQEALQKIAPTDFSKFQLLLQLLQPKGESSIGWTSKKSEDRLVLFTERIATLDWLAEHLPSALKLKTNQVAVLHGGLSDIDQQKIVESFGSGDSKVRLLLASDVASEGINLHHFSHRLVHFDIPWSLLTFQQRNGRVDRYGQQEQPHLYYLQTHSAHPRIQGDQRILEILIGKDRQVQENIGDPSEFTGIASAEEEVEHIAQAIEGGTTPEEFSQNFGQLDPSDLDDPFLRTLLGGLPQGESVEETVTTEQLTTENSSLFANDYQWARAAFDFARHRLEQALQLDFHDSDQSIHFTVPDDFRDRHKRLPKEAFPKDRQLILTTKRDAVMAEIEHCRLEEGRWPETQLLWELHPVMKWLNDKVLSAFGRHEAPVVSLPTLSEGETIILTSGLLPNRKGHPLVQRWVGIRFLGEKLTEVLTLPEVFARTEFDTGTFPNPEQAIQSDSIRTLIPHAIEATREVLHTAKSETDQSLSPLLKEQLDRLKSFQTERQQQLELLFEKSEQRRASEQRKVTNLVEEYERWIRDTLTTEDNPSITLAVIFTSQPA